MFTPTYSWDKDGQLHCSCYICRHPWLSVAVALAAEAGLFGIGAGAWALWVTP